jgi:N-formylglutamate amidohydrolase
MEEEEGVIQLFPWKTIFIRELYGQPYSTCHSIDVELGAQLVRLDL